MCYKLVKTFRFKTDTVIMPLTNACQIKWLKSQCEKLQAFLKQFKKPNTVTKLNIIVKQYSKRKIGQRPRNMGLMLAIGLPKMPFITTSGSSWYDSFKSYDERYTSYKSAFRRWWFKHSRILKQSLAILIQPWLVLIRSNSKDWYAWQPQSHTYDFFNTLQALTATYS